MPALKVIFDHNLKAEYENLFSKCIINHDRVAIVDHFAQAIAANRARYEAIAIQVHCPWFVVGMIHYIECRLDFGKHLHNGDPLTARTKNVPQGHPVIGRPPFNFDASALDALRLRNINAWHDWSISGILYTLEGYNGYGYRQYHPAVKSPYLWSFTNQYTKGKYTKDGHFDPNCVSQQIGLAAIIKRMVELKLISV